MNSYVPPVVIAVLLGLVLLALGLGSLRSSIFGELSRSFYRLRTRWIEWRCERMRAYLLTHDDEYRFRCVGLEVVRRREVFRDEGGDPGDAEYPDRASVERDLSAPWWKKHRHHDALKDPSMFDVF